MVRRRARSRSRSRSRIERPRTRTRTRTSTNGERPLRIAGSLLACPGKLPEPPQSRRAARASSWLADAAPRCSLQVRGDLLDVVAALEDRRVLVEVLEEDPRPERDAGERILGLVDREADALLDELVDP